MCDWYDIIREGIGYKRDHHGINSINTTQRLNTHEPYVLATQANQVYYVRRMKDSVWSFVIETKPRNLFEISMEEEEPYQEEESIMHDINVVEDANEEITWERNEIDCMILG